jgi:hypothetical protein
VIDGVVKIVKVDKVLEVLGDPRTVETVRPNVILSLVREGPQGSSWQRTFETVSKNLEAYPATFVRTNGVLTSIIYNLGDGLSITKTFGYAAGRLTAITLSGDTPAGIALTKTLGYTGDELTSVEYS